MCISDIFPFCTRGRNVYVQFSSHQELTTMDQNAQGRGDEVGTFSACVIAIIIVFLVDVAGWFYYLLIFKYFFLQASFFFPTISSDDIIE